MTNDLYCRAVYHALIWNERTRLVGGEGEQFIDPLPAGGSTIRRQIPGA